MEYKLEYRLEELKDSFSKKESFEKLEINLVDSIIYVRIENIKRGVFKLNVKYESDYCSTESDNVLDWFPDTIFKKQECQQVVYIGKEPFRYDLNKNYFYDSDALEFIYDIFRIVARHINWVTRQGFWK